MPRLRSFTPLVPLVCRLISFAGPDPSGSPGPSQLCRRCSHPPRRLPDQAAPNSHPAAATTTRRGLTPPSVIRASRRTSASRRTKTQIQALDRTQPILPIEFGRTEKRTHDYVRHGTTNLLAALDAATGHVTARCFPKRRGSEFLTFMKTVAAAYPDRELHVVVDNLSTHTSDEVKAWLAHHPRVIFHFTPTGSSWLNMIVRHASRMSTATLIEGGAA
ncbi:IS630 family transposase [Plantactinospora sp. KLBMP9567]|uniref:IS630 family transposase n=1 Tax=Plantactinospora sp. KLBMP9567 TaxID=3085900 RepID=UPI00298205C7|nr:IS630 family transposase [Plantactinospora sp. KLBMP9567]MDW5327133.1 IS630 family transposase [Plantactinospora sp. KLBMP9567]